MKLLNADAKELQRKLTQYLHDDPRFREVYAYTQKRFYKATNLPAHNWAHIYRDIFNGIVVGEAEGADMSVVLPAITMHDIGFLYGANGKTHGAVGAEKLREYLHDGNIQYPPKIIESIADCIRTHKGSMHNEKPASIEAKVVADADLIEKFGPIGVYQNIRTFTEFNWPLEKNLARATEIFDLTLETPTGRSIAEKGRQFVADFYNDLAEATGPYSSIDNL